MYLDESGFAQSMPRTHGYSFRGERCFGQHNWQIKKRTNVIGALVAGALAAFCLFSCHIDSNVFHAWVINSLLPILPANTVIIMDNASFHKRQNTQTAIQQAGHVLEYLPSYSPDLNPIEHKRAHAKALRRKHQCSIEELFQLYVK